MKQPKQWDMQDAKRMLDWLESPDVDEGDALVQAMHAAWVPIDERRPRPDSVILVSDGRELALGRVDGQGGVGLDRIPWTPTHWLPLPPPPAPLENKNEQSIFRHNKVWRRY
ncbi:MAG: hypothetical protein HQL99_07665 [Magnetococcales bacterium]|nr:hypothetical protein [Magnetococcales bacterium]